MYPIAYTFVCMHIGYNNVAVIPSGARHVSITDDGTSGNNMFIGMYVCTYVCMFVPHSLILLRTKLL